MDARVEYFRNKITNRIEQLHPYMAEEKFVLYKRMIEDCDSFEELREVAEMDLQFNLAIYLKGIETELSAHDTNTKDLNAVTNSNDRAARVAVIASRNSKNKHKDFDYKTVVNDLETTRLSDVAVNLLYKRIQDADNQYAADDIADLENNIDGLDDQSETYEDDTDDYDDSDESEEDGLTIEDDSAQYEDIDETEEDNTEESENNTEESEEDYMNSVIDFGDEVTDVKESDNSENIDGLDIEDDESFEVDDEPEETDTTSGEVDNDFEVDDDNFEVDDETSEESDNNFEVDDDNFEVDDDSYTDPDSLYEYEEDTEQDDEDTEQDDIDNSYEENDTFEVDTDNFEDDTDNYDDESQDISEVFGDSGDIDESSLKQDTPEDDLEWFNEHAKHEKKIVTPQNVFLNGTKRGEQTQQVYNIIGNIVNKLGILNQKSINKINSSINRQ